MRLNETLFEDDFIRTIIPLYSAFHRPTENQYVETPSHYKDLQKDDFCRLPRRYPRKDARFSLVDLRCRNLDRFLELLSPLTLYHFSKSSKELYYRCLDTRGLEFKQSIPYPLGEPGETTLDGFEGKRVGFVLNDSFIRFQSCHVSLSVTLSGFVENPERLDFLLRHKVLQFTVDCEVADQVMTALCDRIFHQGLEHVQLFIKRTTQKPDDKEEKHKGKLCAEQFNRILDHCKDVKTLTIQFDNPAKKNKIKFSGIQTLIESWASRTSRLELFFLLYNGHWFQLQDRQLRRLVHVSSTWHLSDKCDIDSHKYPIYSVHHLHAQYSKTVDFCKRLHIDDIINEIF